jgi:hypothetical protein
VTSLPRCACPFCAAAVEPDDPVCGACGAHLEGAGELLRTTPSVTAEHRVPHLPEDLAGAGAGEPSTTAMAVDAARAPGACAWCRRDAGQVRKLVGAAGVAICDGCVALCVDILEAELGPGWR